jgi:hypothetical protein
MLQFAKLLPTLSQWPNAFSTRFSQMTFFLFALLFTHLNLAILILVWCLRIPPRWYKFLNTVAHTSFAWAALDVALASMVITLLETSKTNLVPCHASCQATLAKLLKPGDHLQNDYDRGVEVHIAFDCNSVIGPAYMYLVFGCALHHVIGRRVMNLLEHGVGAQLEIEAHPSLFGADSSVTDLLDSIRNEGSVEIELTNSSSSGGSDDELPKNAAGVSLAELSDGSTAPYPRSKQI